MQCMKGLKFPDGYAIGSKSHDYHIIMERLLSVMFRGYLDDVVWMILVELSYFYR
jgi:hypothetical protein